MAQVTMTIVAKVTAIQIDTTSEEPQLVISADLVDAASGLPVRSVKGNPTATLTQTQKDRIAAIVAQAQAWADARLAQILGS